MSQLQKSTPGKDPRSLPHLRDRSASLHLEGDRFGFTITVRNTWGLLTPQMRSGRSQRAAHELSHIQPSPPALRIFDAGVGDGSVLSHLLRSTHQKFPTIPLFVVGKEISLEDVRLCLENLPDRFAEHPASVICITNLLYSEAPWLMPGNISSAAALNWR